MKHHGLNNRDNISQLLDPSISVDDFSSTHGQCVLPVCLTSEQGVLGTVWPIFYLQTFILSRTGLKRAFRIYKRFSAFSLNLARIWCCTVQKAYYAAHAYQNKKIEKLFILSLKASDIDCVTIYNFNKIIWYLGWLQPCPAQSQFFFF